jgi:Uma2 family endonuclease
MIVVEVLSRSSARTDVGAKLADYFAVPTICHYIILEPARRVAIHHRRDSEAGDIHTRILHDGLLTLDPPGLAIEVDALFGAR